jgi:toxin YoeB
MRPWRKWACEKRRIRPGAFDDLAWWAEQDRAQAIRIIRLVQDTQLDPFAGIGKPEPLRHELAGCWSRRIDQEHRLVYHVLPDKIRILACRYHYQH